MRSTINKTNHCKKASKTFEQHAYKLEILKNKLKCHKSAEFTQIQHSPYTSKRGKHTHSI